MQCAIPASTQATNYTEPTAAANLKLCNDPNVFELDHDLTNETLEGSIMENCDHPAESEEEQSAEEQK